ncbi:DUF167 domain-containing protein [Desulfovibrio ferrophilus]|uniref:UPF0235 protein DFE_0747 n=1 Tax=Desulfovibrio ferrophilus TaxID=241368 RepID=A0A2Z6AWA6_9BACT|nr:DUF167 domain-containing protein [Desulfovibrio ferrophilus]BBD07473.1 UPF0235 protein Dvul_1694 [Desulfovibrio ferrophilus]
MAAVPEYAEQIDGAWWLKVWVQPGAKKSLLDGIHDGRLKIRLQAPAVENKANKALVAFVAKTFGIKRNRVALVRGEKSRAKTLVIDSETSPEWP